MYYQNLVKKGPMYAFLATVVLIIIALIPIFSGMEAFSGLPTADQPYSPQGDIFYTSLYITVILLVLSVAAAVLLSLFQVVSNPKGALKGLLGFGILIVLFFVFYAMSDGAATGSLGETIEKFEVSESVSKIIGAGIRLTLFLGVGSVILMVILEVWNYFKNQ